MDREDIRIGKTVYRQEDVYNQDSRWVRGIIVGIRTNVPCTIGDSSWVDPLVVDVQWENKNHSSPGYFPEGLYDYPLYVKCVHCQLKIDGREIFLLMEIPYCPRCVFCVLRNRLDEGEKINGIAVLNEKKFADV